MQDSNLAIISICGISLICATLVGGIIFLVLRFTGHTISEFLGGGLSQTIDSLAGAQKPSTVGDRVRRRTTPSDLRAQAESLDFDAAVARYRENPGAAAPSPSSQTTRPTRDPAPPDRSSRRRSRRRSSDDAEEMDGMLGGFIDEDGNDILPF